MPRAVDLRLDAIKLAQDRRVLTATAVAPPLNFVTTEFSRDLDWLTAAVDSDDTVGAVVLTGGLPGRFLIHVATCAPPNFGIARYVAGSRGLLHWPPDDGSYRGKCTWILRSSPRLQRRPHLEPQRDQLRRLCPSRKHPSTSAPF
jgi:hypothetical protein